ncbi:unnamed protein product [Calypogeia fissa]
MALFQIRSKSMVAVLAVWWMIFPLPPGFVDGGNLYNVGTYGWTDIARNNDGTYFLFEQWAESLTLTVTDALYFTDRVLPQYEVVEVFSLDDWESCSAANGAKISPDADNVVIYNFTSPGWYYFISPTFFNCIDFMRFKVNVPDLSGQISDPGSGHRHGRSEPGTPGTAAPAPTPQFSVPQPPGSADGGLYTVRWLQTVGDDGHIFNYQQWADSLFLTTYDAIDFYYQEPIEQYGAALVGTLTEMNNCDASNSTKLPSIGGGFMEYNVTTTGKFYFISVSEDLCRNWSMKFMVSVYDSKGSVARQIGQPPSQPPTGQLPGHLPQNTIQSPQVDQPARGGIFPQGGQSPLSTQSPGQSPMAGQQGLSHLAKWKNGYNMIWIAAATGTAVVLALIAMAFLFKRRLRKWLEKSSNQEADVSHKITYTHSLRSTPLHTKVEVEAAVDPTEWLSGPHKFSYDELKVATDSFNATLKIGEGGFGAVYKGYLRHSPDTPVAVKRLSQFARQGVREFMAEVNIISQLRHRNLVQLLGWCDENSELMLVYEYMPYGDLEHHIFGGYEGNEAEGFTPLEWGHRYNILCGVATALVYLHEEWEQRVVHRDVKTSNVMLDSKFNARLGDFGLARLSAHSQVPKTTILAGTIGYLAPEFILTGRATDKTDVYAFGIVTLEVVCAKRSFTFNFSLLDWVWDLRKEDKLLDALDATLDVRSACHEDREEMEMALQIGLMCCHPDSRERPSMRQVLNMLVGETPLQEMPRSKPVAYLSYDR